MARKETEHRHASGTGHVADETSVKPADPGERGQFGSRIGFILAAIGSAVGFGSIARFPMNAANNGGAMFLLMYLGIMVLFGIPLMIAEFSMGRTAQRNTVGAFRVLTGKTRPKWMAAGYLYFLAAAFILSYYAVLSGWTLRYFFGSLTGAYFSDPTGSYLTETQEGPIALFWLAVVMGLTAYVLLGKVSKGIEKVNLVMMPALYAIIIGLAIYAATRPSVGRGYEYYLQPDMSAFTVPVMAAAVGQAFFSLSLGQGAMMVYSSYLSRKSSLASNASVISFSTLTFATTCGFLIFPLLATFSLGPFGTPPNFAGGLGLIFGPLSQAFSQMGQPVGNIVGALFFLATFFASFTSAVSLAEPAIAYMIEEHGIDRRRASLLVCALIYIAGIPVAFDLELLDLEGLALTDFVVILGGLLIALFVGWSTPRRKAIERMDESEGGLRLGRLVQPLVRYLLPAVLGTLLLFAVTGTPCNLTGKDVDGKPNESQGLLQQFFGVNPLGCQSTTPDGFQAQSGGAGWDAFLFAATWILLAAFLAFTAMAVRQTLRRDANGLSWTVAAAIAYALLAWVVIGYAFVADALAAFWVWTIAGGAFFVVVALIVVHVLRWWRQPRPAATA